MVVVRSSRLFARRHGNYGCVLEARVERFERRLRVDSYPCETHQERSGTKDRCPRCPVGCPTVAFRAYHRKMMWMHLDHLQYVKKQIEELETEIDKLLHPHQKAIELLMTILGVKEGHELRTPPHCKKSTTLRQSINKGPQVANSLFQATDCINKRPSSPFSVNSVQTRGKVHANGRESDRHGGPHQNDG